MFDLISFIEKLSAVTDIEKIKPILDAGALSYHLGKIVIKSDDIDEKYEYIFSNNYASKPLMTFSRNGFDYLAFNKLDGYSYSKEESDDILVFLKLIAIHHYVVNTVIFAESAKNLNPMTGLYNSHGYLGKIQEKEHHIKLSEYNSYFVNIKGFGLVNSIFGVKQGDYAIIKYAEHFASFVNDDEIVGHLGGDNFVALIKKERHQQFLDFVANYSINLEKDGAIKKVNLVGVVGYFSLDSESFDYSHIISNASMACQYARNNRKMVVELTPEIADMLSFSKHIEITFKEELEKGNFIVYYQPKFDIKSGKIIGVEALSRWNYNGKILPPGVFVPILEKNGEIINLDLHILDNLCRDIHNYRNMGHLIVPASCNLSRRDFEDPNLEEKVINIIKQYNVKTEDIVIEVTETTNLEEKERLAKFILVMNQNGIMTSIDDFGTGYSSLSVLRDFNVNEIKIDRSFIDRKVLTNSDKIIIGSIIDMAKKLNLNVICEGVETEKQAQFLINLGCNNAQGYLYSKPLPKLEFEALMQKIGTVWDK